MDTKFNKKLLILLTGLLIINCAGDMEPRDPPPPTGNPVGEYRVTKVRKYWEFTTDIGTQTSQETVTEDCDFLSTVKFRSNGTMEFINHDINNDGGCSDIEIINGTWQSEGPISDGFRGSVDFNNPFERFNMYGGGYQSQGEGQIALWLWFNIITDGQEYIYTFESLKL